MTTMILGCVGVTDDGGEAVGVGIFATSGRYAEAIVGVGSRSSFRVLGGLVELRVPSAVTVDVGNGIPTVLVEAVVLVGSGSDGWR